MKLVVSTVVSILSQGGIGAIQVGGFAYALGIEGPDLADCAQGGFFARTGLYVLVRVIGSVFR